MNNSHYLSKTKTYPSIASLSDTQLKIFQTKTLTFMIYVNDQLVRMQTIF